MPLRFAPPYAIEAEPRPFDRDAREQRSQSQQHYE